MTNEVGQTTWADMRAGWRVFRAWKERFHLSCLRLDPKTYNDIVFLADDSQIYTLASEYHTELWRDIPTAREQKTDFMQAYLSVMALGARHFERETRELLKLQSRKGAASALGFWFWRSLLPDDAFGPGASPFFQGTSSSLFCRTPTQIDFADVFAVMPYNCTTIRRPFGKWSIAGAQRVAWRIESDFASAGVEAEVAFKTSDEFLEVSITAHDFEQCQNANWLRASRGAAVFEKLESRRAPREKRPASVLEGASDWDV